MAEYGEPLTEREVEVLELLATGATNRQIAQELVLSVNTVKVHLNNIYTKLGAQSRTEASMLALSDGLIGGPELAAAPEDKEAAPGMLAPEQAAPGEAERTTAATAAAPPPLPWPKRVALVVGLVLAVLASAVSWPRSQTSAVAADPGTDNLVNGSGSSNLASSDTKWRALAPMTTARARFALVAASNGQLFAIGGETNGGVTDSVERFDPATNQWSLLASNKPTRVSNVNGAAIEDWIYVPGGRTPNGEPTAAVEAYNWRENEWKQVSPLPHALYAYTLAMYKDELYLFGGYDNRAYANTVWIYNPADDGWREGAAMPTKRAFAAAAALGSRIFVVGGYDGRREQDVCEVYDPQASRWESCRPLMLGRGGLGLAGVANQLFAVGGGWSNYLAFSELYDPKAAEWLPFETPVGSQWHNLAVASRPDRFYVAGGWNGGWLNGVWEYEVLWQKILMPIAP